jgi:hypothetical protein
MFPLTIYIYIYIYVCKIQLILKFKQYNTTYCFEKITIQKQFKIKYKKISEEGNPETIRKALCFKAGEVSPCENENEIGNQRK